MKKLIVNADDLGFSREINDAVADCLFRKRVTSVSLMAVGPVFTEASKLLHDLNRTDTGVHLCLTSELIPCHQNRKEIRSILDAKGRFHAGYTGLLPGYFTGKFDMRHVYIEFKAQINKVKTKDLNITHLDSHEHVHMLPGIFKVVMDLAEEFNIPYVRYTSEDPIVMLKRSSPRNVARYIALKLASMGVAPANKKVMTNDRFFGHFHSGNIDDDVFCFLLDHMKDGVNEIAFHPAAATYSFTRLFPEYKNSAKELETLLEGIWLKVAEEHKIELVGHDGV